MKESDPPLCATHQKAAINQTRISSPAETTPATSLDFYSRSFSFEEVSALVDLALASSLNGEVAASRIAIRRILQQLEEELSPSEYAQLAGLIFRGANTIAQLLRAQRSLSGTTAEGIIESLAKGLDEMSYNWKVDL